jgi:predicted nuclease with TOPRIM domain
MNKKIEAIEKMMGTSDQKEEKKALAAELKELEINIEKANERIQGIFEAQDMAQKKIAAFDTDIHRFHQETKDLETEKQKVLEQIQKNDPIPMLKVGKKIFAGTRIASIGSFKEIHADCGMAKFEGTGPADGDGPGRIVQHTL